MSSKRRRYTAEFKAEAVRLVNEENLSHSQVGTDLGIHPSLVGRWVLAAEQRSAPGALSDDERQELARLRRENRTLRKERDILKKAAAFFASETL